MTSNPPVRVFVADDHEIVRQGIRSLLEGFPGLQIVGEATDGLEALDMVDHLQPDVIIVDMLMPGINGLEVTRQAVKRLPEVRVVVLSMHSNEAYVVEALRAGAMAYVLKTASVAELTNAVQEAAAGRRYLCSPLSERAIQVYIESAKETSFDGGDTLTEREREILQLVAQSYSNTEIAARLGISPRTAETHRANMMRKLGLQNQTDVIRYALQQKIISLD